MTRVAIPRRVPLRYLIHVRTFLPTMAWVIGLSAIAATPSFDVVSLGTWILLHSVTLVVAGLAAIGVREALRLAGVHEVPLRWVVATGAVAGAVKALTTAWAENTFTLSEDIPLSALVVRAIGSVVVGVWLVTVVAYALAAVERLDEARTSLIRRNVAKRLAEESSLLRPEVEASLRAIQGLRRRLRDGSERARQDEIRGVVDSTIRPLSRAMWSVENARYPALKLTSLYRIGLKSIRLRPLWIALIWAGTSFTGLAVSTGIPNSAAYTAAVGLVAIVVFSVLRLGWTQSVIVSVVAVIFASAGTVLGGYLLSRLIVPTVASAIPLPVMVAGVAWMTFVTLGVTVISAWTELREVISRDLESSQTQDLIDRRSASAASEVSTRRVATELHGSVQSKLLGIAAAIDHNSLSQADIDVRLGEVEKELERMTSGGLSGSVAYDGRQSLEDVIAAWEGIVNITVDSAPGEPLEKLLTAAPEAVELIREAITNAYRHGLASHVSVSANTDGSGGYVLRVIDDGYGPRNGKPGLGSDLLDRWTGGHWSLTADGERGSVLDARITPLTSDRTNPANTRQESRGSNQ